MCRFNFFLLVIMVNKKSFFLCFFVFFCFFCIFVLVTVVFLRFYDFTILFYLPQRVYLALPPPLPTVSNPSSASCCFSKSLPLGNETIVNALSTSLRRAARATFSSSVYGGGVLGGFDERHS